MTQVPNGVGLLVALVASSSLAYVWPRISDVRDPFIVSPGFLLGLVSLTMFCLGLVVEREELSELRQRPASVLFGVIVQCAWMPLLAFLAVQTLQLDGGMAQGVFLAGCVPGAMASNVLTMTARGNVSYSVSLTTIATLLSPITVPFTLAIVAGVSADAELFQPKRTALILLGTVVLPVVLGFLVTRLLPTLRKRISVWAQPLATLCLLWIIASVVAGNRDRLAQVQVTLLLALLAINVGGYAGGWAFAKLVFLPVGMRRALTLEVGMQNAGLGTALAATLFGSDSLAQIPTAAYTFGCMLTGTILAGFWSSQTTETSSALTSPEPSSADAD